MKWKLLYFRDYLGSNFIGRLSKVVVPVSGGGWPI